MADESKPTSDTSKSSAKTAQDQAPEEPRFSRERVLNMTEGPRIVGLPHPAIVGALASDEGSDFTRAEVVAKVKAFRARKISKEA